MNKTLAKGILFVGLAYLGAGCHITRIAEIRELREPRDAQEHYFKIAVNYLNKGILYKKEAETVIADSLKSRAKHLDVIKCFEIFDPARNYTDDEIAKELKSRGCDGYLTMGLLNRSYLTDEGMIAGHSDKKLATYAFEHEIKLYDLKNGDCVWNLFVKSEAPSSHFYRETMKSVGNKMTQLILNSGLVF